VSAIVPVIQPYSTRLQRRNASTFWGVGIIGLASLVGMAVMVRDPKEKKPLVLHPLKGS